MARVILAPFIESISGKVGDLEFRTLKSGKTVVRTRKRDEYAVSRCPSEKELAQRRRFSVVSSVVSRIQRDYDRIDKAASDRKKIWQKVSYLYGKYYEEIMDNKKLQDRLYEVYRSR